MPILPLNHTEPFAATIGVMLYPGTSEEERKKARAWTAGVLAGPLSRFRELGGEFAADDLMQLLRDRQEPLGDYQQRWWGGTAIGQVFKAYFILANNAPDRASWENALRIAGWVAENVGVPGSRSLLYQERSRFLSVAHLWGAWAIREGKFRRYPDIGYDSAVDFQFFLTEAEILRRWGQTWRASRAKSEPPLPAEVWRIPDGWQPPEWRPEWPITGAIPDLALPEDLVQRLRPAGRPRKIV